MESISRIEEWQRVQEELRVRLVTCDTIEWQQQRCLCDCSGHPCQRPCAHLRLCGGVDISFVKDDAVNACAALVVVDVLNHSVVYQDCQMVQLVEPYVPGYLAFREVNFFVDLITKAKRESPDCFPQVILVDGNGLLHPRMFGLACHLGVLTGLPTIGTAKSLHCIDGLTKKGANFYCKDELQTALGPEGDAFPLVGQSGKVLGAALTSTKEVTNPIFVSVGHGISLDTALWVVRATARYRVPEPVRQADILSRQHIRTCWPPKT